MTDKDPVKEIINKYRFPDDMEVYFAPATSQLHVQPGNTFVEAYKVDSDEPQEVGLEVPHTPAFGEFLTEIAPFIATDDALMIQLIGFGITDEPLIGVEWVVENDEISETSFTHGKSSKWTELAETTPI